MLIKEYRIPLPMSVEEYRIAQLYMIQRKSREESQGAGSGVEILINEPYSDGPGGSGQYTYKIYHIGSHLPGWFRAILPKSALRVEEEAWNAYPYTKTRYRCPFVEKFLLEIETKYFNDGGDKENVFNLSQAEIRQRNVDIMDIVKDPVSDYRKEEDPKVYKSEKTGRGPLNDNWRQECCNAIRNPANKDTAIMTAYKLCKVEFRYWGMQTKIERFIHDIGLRKTMLRAHRQAWCWQDEYYGLKLSDIRRLERETQIALLEKMANANDDEGGNPIESLSHRRSRKSNSDVFDDQKVCTSKSFDHLSSSSKNSISSLQSDSTPTNENGPPTNLRFVKQTSVSKLTIGESSHSLSDWRGESIEQLQESSSDEDEFFDAQEKVDDEEDVSQSVHLMRSTSMELIPSSDYDSDADASATGSATEESPLDKRLERYRHLHSIDISLPCSLPGNLPSTAPCRSSILFLVLHGGSLLESSQEQTMKRGDLSTLKGTFETVIKAHYPSAYGRVAFRLIPCPSSCAETLSILSSLSPYRYDFQSLKNSNSNLAMTQEFIPIGAIALFASSNPEYQEHVSSVMNKANLIYQDFLKSEDGIGFTGQVCLLADSVGSLLAYDALCRSNPLYSQASSRYGSHNSLSELDNLNCHQRTFSYKRAQFQERQLSQSDPDLTQFPTEIDEPFERQHTKTDSVSSDSDLKRQGSARQDNKHLNVHSTSGSTSRRTSSGSHYEACQMKLDFEVADFFMLGAPLGLVLSFRRLFFGEDKNSPPLRPTCHQVYNLFHLNDPSAIRLEPLVHHGFKGVSPIHLPRYSKFPLGDGESFHVVEAVQNNLNMLSENRKCSVSPGHPVLQRQSSNTSITSQVSGLGEFTVASITNVTSKWWGNKRLDYILYCPEALHNFHPNALPQLFHSSFWESCDLVAFILRQVLRQDMMAHDFTDSAPLRDSMNAFSPSEPREKWLKRRTTIKVRNLTPNHRANDIVVLEDTEQGLNARFMYGPLDMTSLSGEKVDIHVMQQPPLGDWKLLGTSISDSHGRLAYTISEDQRLSQGMYPVKMVVRGDHTSVDFFMTVLPPKTEVVVFSIDGSFTASVSIMGKDPKVRAGAVDVVRHWMELGYLILYVTARPDMQHKKVVAWLAQHNFPHGMVSFMDGLSKDPLRQKLNYLKGLQTDAEVVYKAAYGSSKDIYVYKEVGMKPSQIYIVGKSSKKQQSQAQIISEGYAAHLSALVAPGGSRPASGNARLFIRKSCFSLPTPMESKRPARRTVSLPQGNSPPASAMDQSFRMDSAPLGNVGITVTQASNTELDATDTSSCGCSSRSRGSSPRPKLLHKDSNV